MRAMLVHRESWAGMRNKADWIRASAVFLVILFISTLHYLTPPELIYWHYVFQRLFYLPVIYAALRFGWRGGLATAIFAWVFYFPPILVSWRDLPHYSLSQYLEVIVFCLAGILTGVMADRERKQRGMLQRRTEELSRVYGELQNNFERMKRAERLYAVGQLSAGLAHEIRNPLASIAGAVGLLRRNRVSDERRAECLEIVNKECGHLDRLLTNFLDFARPRPPKFQPTDLAQLLDSVVDLSAHAIGDAQIKLRKEIDLGLPSMNCDPEQLKQVLLNLIINAFQAMPEGGEIIVTASNQDGNALIQVKDQGCGIATENLDKIFDPFFTTKKNGSGLGLSVAHQIVGQFGGALKAERNRDRGMTFSVLLPLAPRGEI